MFASSRRHHPVRAVTLPVSLLLATLLIPAAFAQSDESTTLSPLLITPTRLPTPESEVASSVTVITAADIARKQERTLPDVLQDVPGLNVVQTGGPGNSAQVYIRGTNANEVKFFLDGIEISDPNAPNGAFDFSSILTADIARIEVLRGPQSGLYGADAIGGVINIITKQGSGPPRATASIEGGSFGTVNESAGVSGSQQRLSYAFDVAHFHSNSTTVTPAPLVAAGRTVTPDAYDNKTASGKLAAKLTDDLDVGLVTRYTSSALNFTEDDFLGPEAMQSETDSHQLATSGTAHLALFDGLFDQTVGLSYLDDESRTYDPNAGTSVFGNDPDDFHGDRLKGTWQGNIKVSPTQVITLGAEHQLDRINDTTPVNAEVSNNAGYAQLQSSFGEHVFDTVSLRYDSNQQFGSKLTYRVAPAYLIPETGTKFKGSIGTGFNPPTLTQLYQSFPAFGFFANSALLPETSIGYDAGIEQAILGKRIQTGATYFHNNIDNLITLNSMGTSYQNVGKATTEGVESFVSYKPLDILTLRVDYTRTIANDDILHQELLRRPKNKASGDAAWQVTTAAQLSVTTVYVGPTFDVTRSGSASGVPLNGYMTVNLAGSYDLGHGITAFARVDNLLDRHYQDPLGFQHQGLGVFGGLRVAFGGTPSEAKP